MNKVSVFEPKDCKRVQKLLDHFLSGELTVESNQEILQHLEHCSACQAQEKSWLEARRLLVEGWDAQSVPAGLEDRVVKGLEGKNMGPASGAATSGRADFDGGGNGSRGLVFSLDEREHRIADGGRSL